MDEKSFEQECAFLTVRIEIDDVPEPGLGTGFLYLAPHSGGAKSITLLISNRHAFVSPKGTVRMSLNRTKGDGTPDFGNVVTFTQRNFEHVYFEHPDAAVDLACINVSQFTHEKAYFRPRSSDFLEPPLDERKLHPGTDVLFVGYPDGRYDVVNHLPLIRRGTIASVPAIDFNGIGQIVIDGHVHKGSSGSPVFVAVDGHYRLLGVLAETMVSDEQLVALPAGAQDFPIETVIGLGLAIKQRHVIELIDVAVKQYLERAKPAGQSTS